MQAAWPEFASRRRERLQQGLFDAPVEKIAENIVEDLLQQFSIGRSAT